MFLVAGAHAASFAQFIRADEDIEDGSKSIEYGSPHDNAQLFTQLLVCWGRGSLLGDCK